MKRMWVAIPLLLGIFLLCGLSSWYQVCKTDDLIEELDGLQKVWQEQSPQWEEKRDAFQESFDRSTALFTFFIDQDGLEKCRQTMWELDSLSLSSPQERADELFVECRSALRLLQIQEIPNAENLL